MVPRYGASLTCPLPPQAGFREYFGRTGINVRDAFDAARIHSGVRGCVESPHRNQAEGEVGQHNRGRYGQQGTNDKYGDLEI